MVSAAASGLSDSAGNLRIWRVRLAVGVALVVAALTMSASRAIESPSAQPLQGDEGWWARTDPGLRGSVPRSRFYTIRSDLPAAETKAYADLLDTMYLEYTRLMTGLRKRGREHLDVFMFASQQDYLDTLRSRFGANGAGSGGMFFIGPKGAGLAFFTDRIPRSRVEHVIRHEGFHQIAHIYFDGDLPPWANEGLAEYFGEAVVVSGTTIEGQVTSRTVSTVKKLIETDRVIPFATLLSKDLRQWNGAVGDGTALAQYSQSASMVHFLLWGEGGRLSSNFSAYLRNLNDGRDSISSFRMAFGGTDDRSLADFERRWRAFVKDQTPGSVRAAVERLSFFADGLTALREKGIYPETLDELRAALVREGFEQAVGAHGSVATLRPDDDALFQIPVDAIQDKRRLPIFEFSIKGPRTTKPPKRKEGGGGLGSGGEEGSSSKSAEKPVKPPPPAEVSTKNLRPRDLKISWTLDADDHWRADIRLK